MATASNRTSIVKPFVLALGVVMLGYGVLALILGSNSFDVVDVPDGPAAGETFLDIEGNGWTSLLWIAAGGVLVLGSPFVRIARAGAVLSGLALGAAGVISLLTQWFDDNWGVFGIFAANQWTTLAWGVTAVLSLAGAFLPRGGGREPTHEHAATPTGARVSEERFMRDSERSGRP